MGRPKQIKTKQVPNVKTGEYAKRITMKQRQAIYQIESLN